MLELIQESISIINLPLTVLLILTVIYWCLVILGLVDIEALDFDVDVEGGGGVGHALLSFFSIGEVPFMAVISFMVLSMWSISMLMNYYLNDGSILLGVVYLVPNIVVSRLIAGVFSMPLKKLFHNLNKDVKEEKSIVGEVCVIVTSEVTESFGRAEVQNEGAPIVINVRPAVGDETHGFKKNDKAVIVDKDEERDLFYIKKVDW